MLLADGALRVLVGRLSVSDTMTDTVKPVRLLFNDASGSITCYVRTFILFTYIFSVGVIWTTGIELTITFDQF